MNDQNLDELLKVQDHLDESQFTQNVMNSLPEQGLAKKRAQILAGSLIAGSLGALAFLPDFSLINELSKMGSESTPTSIVIPAVLLVCVVGFMAAIFSAATDEVFD